MTTLHLCEQCAAEKGVESPGSVAKTPLGSFLAAMGKGLPDAAPAARAASDAARAAAASLQDFRESGRLGCPECYRAFEAPLRDLLRRLHGSTHHVGRALRRAGTAPRRTRGSQRLELREQLRLAVETENFELAAELRDRLRVLE